MHEELPGPSPAIRVAFVMTGDIRPYRIPLLELLAAHPALALDIFHGPVKKGSGAPTETPELGVLAERVTAMRGVRWPFGRRQIAWLRGTLGVLTGSFDVVICQETVNNLTVWVFAFLHRVFGKRLILHGWAYRPNDSRTSLLTSSRRLARKVLMRSADVILAYTDRGRIAAIDLGIPQDRIFVSRNTLNTTQLSAIQATINNDEVRDLRRVLSPDDETILLFVGRLQTVKRVDLLIEAVALLRASGHPCKLIVIGDGPDRTRLEGLSVAVGDVRFMGAIYNEHDLAPFFLAADLLVIPGRIGLTCVHAFSYGLPVVTASDEVMLQTPEYDYVQNGRNGIIVDALSADAFSQAIARVLQDRAILELLKDGARRSANQLTMDQMVDGFVAAIRFAAAATH